MKKIKLIAAVLLLLGSNTFAQQTSQSDAFNGDQLFATVKKFVGLGIHRTGTLTDYNTSAWLSHELISYGYKVNYLEFSLKQFFWKVLRLLQGKIISRYSRFGM